MSKCKPFKQGHLDGLCGAYCLVNAVHYLHSYIDDEQAETIFIEVLHELKDSTDLLVRLEEGTGRREIRQLMGYLNKEHNINWHKPFNYNSSLSLNHIWSNMKHFLDEPGHNLILLLIRYEDDGHWTLINRMSDKTLHLFDSDHMNIIQRRRCTVNRYTRKRPYTFHPTTIYYLTLKP